MSTLRTILLGIGIAALVAFVLWAFTTGPGLLEVIDNPRF